MNRILYKVVSKLCTLTTFNKFTILDIEEYTENNSEPFNTPVCFISISFITSAKYSRRDLFFIL